MNNNSRTKNDITNYSIFGEYKQPENRVTAALLHILRIGKEDLIKDILELGGVNDLPASDILVETQVSTGESVPDGLLSCNFSFKIYIESKIRPNSIDLNQLEKHKKVLDDGSYLIYLTPDAEKPAVLGNDIIWFNWKRIVEILDNFCKITDCEEKYLLSFMVEQFGLLTENLNLNDNIEQRVLIVAGRFGEPVAKDYGFYACQNGRTFRKSRYLAFYSQNRIKDVYIIDEVIDDVDISKCDEIVPQDYFDKYEKNYNEKNRKLFKLKPCNVLENKQIINDAKSKNDPNRTCAYTQGQTYTTIDKLKDAEYTSQL